MYLKPKTIHVKQLLLAEITSRLWNKYEPRAQGIHSFSISAALREHGAVRAGAEAKSRICSCFCHINLSIQGTLNIIWENRPYGVINLLSSCSLLTWDLYSKFYIIIKSFTRATMRF